MNRDLMFSNMGHRCTPLSDSTLFHRCPSVFADSPHEAVSDRYSFIPTIDVVDALRDHNWFPVEALQVKSRKRGNLSKARHMLRFQNPDIEMRGDDGLIPEMVVVNSHDRSTGFRFFGGIFRAMCSNGLITSEETFGSIKLRHNVQGLDHLVENCVTISNQIPTIMEQIDNFKSLRLHGSDQLIFAKGALRMVHRLPAREGVRTIFGDTDEYMRLKAKGETNVNFIPLHPRNLLITRRREDSDGDQLAARNLWTTFNVIQENVMKGGFSFKTTAPTGRRVKSKAITAINENIRINKELWRMAEFIQKRAANG